MIQNIKTLDIKTLAGRLLVAMPHMPDPRFAKSVIFMCDHTSEGAMGMIINKPMETLEQELVLKQLDIKIAQNRSLPVVSDGGPVEKTRGFLLHSPMAKSEKNKDVYKDTRMIADDFALTTTLEALQNCFAGKGPDKSLFVLGYAVWGAGQLEQELQENSWLTLMATPSLVFDTHASDMWAVAYASMGVNPLALSLQSGTA